MFKLSSFVKKINYSKLVKFSVCLISLAMIFIWVDCHKLWEVLSIFNAHTVMSKYKIIYSVWILIQKLNPFYNILSNYK